MLKNQLFWTILVVFVTISPSSVAADPVVAEPKSAYDVKGKRDPFMQLISSNVRQAQGLMGVESVDEIIIEGVVYDPAKGSIVMMNGMVLKEGEEAGSVKVLSVKSEGAMISVNGVEKFITIAQESR